MEHATGTPGDVFDAVIVGGGLGGVFMLAEAVQQRYTNILLLERAQSVGGIWARVPSWQTIQNHPLDFCLQGFTTRKSIWYASDVLHFLAEYVRVQNLAPFIRCSRDVRECSWSDDARCWILRVDSALGPPEEIRCRRLVLCTGRHAIPVVPRIETDGSVSIVHSSAFHRPEDTRGKRVVVVGGGASALDLCVKVLEAQHGGQGRLHWVLRSPKFFSGSGFSRLWPLTILQVLLGTTVSRCILNVVIDAHARFTFWSHGVRSWLPAARFDLRDTQYVPGRTALLENASRIDRHVGVAPKAIVHRTLTLTDGTIISDVDLVLLGTGYAVPAPMAGVGDLDALAVNTFATGKHRGRLFLVGERLLDTTGAAPVVYHAFSRVFWALVRHEQVLEDVLLRAGPAGTSVGNLNNLDVLNRVVAIGSRDARLRPVIRDLFPFARWRATLLWTYIYHALVFRTTVLFADRLLGHNLCLDDPPGRSVGRGSGACPAERVA